MPEEGLTSTRTALRWPDGGHEEALCSPSEQAACGICSRPTLETMQQTHYKPDTGASTTAKFILLPHVLSFSVNHKQKWTVFRLTNGRACSWERWMRRQIKGCQCECLLRATPPGGFPVLCGLTTDTPRGVWTMDGEKEKKGRTGGGGVGSQRKGGEYKDMKWEKKGEVREEEGGTP